MTATRLDISHQPMEAGSLPGLSVFEGTSDTTEAQEVAADRKLDLFTPDFKAAYELYLLSVAGNLKPTHDPMVIIKDLQIAR